MKEGNVLYSCAHTLYSSINKNDNDIIFPSDASSNDLKRISVICNLILCDDCIEVQCFDFRSQNKWSYKISFSLVSAMIHHYVGIISDSYNTDNIKQLNSLWDLIAKSIKLLYKSQEKTKIDLFLH